MLPVIGSKKDANELTINQTKFVMAYLHTNICVISFYVM